MTIVYREFPITKNSNSQISTIRIHEPHHKGSHLGLSTWSASTVLANRLHLIDFPRYTSDTSSSKSNRQCTHDTPFTVLEVGAGTGLVGIAAAIIWGAAVLLTDLPEVTPNLAANVSLNTKEIDDAGGRATIGILNLENPDRLVIDEQKVREPNTLHIQASLGKAKVILAADTVYSEELPSALANTIWMWLERSKEARVIFAYPLRVAYLDYIRELWDLLEAGGLHALEEGKAETGTDWDDECRHEWVIWGWKP